MRALHDRVEGPFAIEGDLALYGSVLGDATLHAGVRLVLHGTIAGDLHVRKVARAIVHGTVSGRIYNDGGRVELFGIVDAIEDLSRDSVTIVDEVAHVLRGRRSTRPR